ncbi:hypothetical protein cypCar_00019653 [Cyprinus carpio]|nr:hypothetical protein cypCar_00019653 [Cyprinus carpio]
MQCWERCHQGVGCLVVGTDFLFATPCLASPTLKSVASKPSPTTVGKTSSKNRLTTNGKPPVGTEVLEVKPKKNKMVITPAKKPPSNVPKKQVKKNQEVICPVVCPSDDCLNVALQELALKYNKISKIPWHALAGLPNLEWLDLSKNKLDDFSLGPDVFRNLTKLRRLNLDGNNFTKVPALPPSLVELKINDNKLSALTPHSFRGLSQLLTLELEDNYFHDGNVSPLAFKPLRRLIYLRLDDNKFRAIPSGLPVSVQELHLSDNKIEVVHSGLLNKTTNLRVLNLSHNRIREDRIHPRAWIHLLKLEYLDLSHNKLVHVPSFLPAGLRQLILHHNQIERIPGYVFGHLRPGLDSLQLSYNRLREDGINEVSFLGLYNSLSELLLDHNQLRSIPRGILQLKNLQHLRMNHNYISYITMNSLCDTAAREDSLLLSVHLEYNLIDRRLIPPTAFSCIKTYQSILLRPQRYEEHHE